MILLSYARYLKIAPLVIAPQGEFARDVKPGGTRVDFALPLGDVARKRGKHPVVLTVPNLVLDRWELFEPILFASQFFERLTVPKGEKRELACGVLADELKKAKIQLADLHQRQSFDSAWTYLQDDKVQKLFYRTDVSRLRLKAALHEADPNECFMDYWGLVAQLFREDRLSARTINKALARLLSLTHDDGSGRDKRPLLVTDPSKQRAQDLYWNEKIQSLVVKRLLDGLQQTAEHPYRANQSLNALVIVDEAHRLAPRVLASEDDVAREVRGVLIDAARTTRKYGLGWLFISQTRSIPHPEILQQLRIFFFGFGLALGQEFQSLRNSSAPPAPHWAYTNCSVIRTRRSTPKAVRTRS